MNLSDEKEIRKSLIDIKLKLDMLDNQTHQAREYVYNLENMLFDMEDLDYSRRYGFLSGVS